MVEKPSVAILVAIVMAVISFQAWGKPGMYAKWILNPYTVKRRNEYYRLLSHGFIHADYPHLIFNGLALYLFGDNVLFITQTILGEIAGIVFFLLLFLAGIVVAALPSYWRHTELPHYNSLGASGGVSTIVFFSIVFFPLSSMGFLFIPIDFNCVLLGTGYLVYSYYKDQQGGGRVNHNAHFVGAVFGVLIGIAMIFLMPEAKAFFNYFWEKGTFTPVSFG